MEGAVSPHLERETLLDVGVRVWAEIGRARMPLGDAVALSQGAVAIRLEAVYPHALVGGE